MLQCVAVCCSVLQCVAVCCSELQSVAVCCSVLQCVAVDWVCWISHNPWKPHTDWYLVWNDWLIPISPHLKVWVIIQEFKQSYVGSPDTLCKNIEWYLLAHTWKCGSTYMNSHIHVWDPLIHPLSQMKAWDPLIYHTFMVASPDTSPLTNGCMRSPDISHIHGGIPWYISSHTWMREISWYITHSYVGSPYTSPNPLIHHKRPVIRLWSILNDMREICNTLQYTATHCNTL